MTTRARQELRAPRQARTLAAVALAALLTAGDAAAVQLRLDLVGTEGGRSTPLGDAVASLHAATAPRAAGATAEIDQRNSTFVPGVIAIQAGTLVTFPNSDNTLHHVYSFSPAKRFELPLYSGKRTDPVLFDKTGVVTLGCNIHDWMVAHVVVLDTPWHGRTGNDGSVRLQAPPGDYVLRIWHQRAAEPYEQRVTLAAGGVQQVVRIATVPATPMPTANDGPSRLRALQQRLRTQPQRTPSGG